MSLRRSGAATHLALAGLLLCAACSGPPDGDAAPAAVSASPGPVQEAVSFAGEPLYRRSVDVAALADADRQIASIRSKDEHAETDYVEIGRLFASTYRYRDAIAAYSTGLLQYPGSFKLRRHRAHRYITVRELDKAIVDLEEAVELMGDAARDFVEYDANGEPNGTYEYWVWYHIGLYRYLTGDYGAAASAFERCVELSSNPTLLIGATDWLYNAYRKNGDAEKANSVIAAIPADIDADPSHPYVKRVMLYKCVVQPDDILDSDKPPGEWTARDITIGYGLANWLRFEGKPEAADPIYRTILGSPYWNAWAYVAAERELSRN